MNSTGTIDESGALFDGGGTVVARRQGGYAERTRGRLRRGEREDGRARRVNARTGAPGGRVDDCAGVSARTDGRAGWARVDGRAGRARGR